MSGTTPARSGAGSSTQSLWEGLTGNVVSSICQPAGMQKQSVTLLQHSILPPTCSATTFSIFTLTAVKLYVKKAFTRKRSAISEWLLPLNLILVITTGWGWPSGRPEKLPRRRKISVLPATITARSNGSPRKLPSSLGRHSLLLTDHSEISLSATIATNYYYQIVNNRTSLASD